jgi:alpha-glucuronidase
VIDGSLHKHARTGIAGVSNVGSDRNWTGSQFNQANWYAYGRLAWDHSLSASAIADEWIRMTFTNDPAAIAPIRAMMLMSREAVVDYMTPLGLAHIMATGHHYGPGPWVSNAGRPDWSPTYYHRADTIGIGFDRTAAGSNAVGQYFGPVRDRYAGDAVPDSVLLWFHRVRWDQKLRSGKPLWEELVRHYYAGVDSVRSMRRKWDSVKGAVDADRFTEVQGFLTIQEKEAIWWRDAAVQYFQTFSRQPIPTDLEQPAHPLAFYRALRCPPVLPKPRCEAVY